VIYHFYSHLSFLVGKHLRHLLDTTAVPQTVVIASGDGSVFAPLATLAVQRGWKVIVFSWSRCLSDKFKRLRLQHPKRVELKLLDEHRHRVTFRAADRAGEMLPGPPMPKPMSPPAGEMGRKTRTRRGTRQPRRGLTQPDQAMVPANMPALMQVPQRPLVQSMSQVVQRC